MKNKILQTKCPKTTSGSHNIVFKKYSVGETSISRWWGDITYPINYSNYYLINKCYCSECNEQFGKVSMEILRHSIAKIQLFKKDFTLIKIVDEYKREVDFTPFLNTHNITEAETFGCYRDKFKNNPYYQIDKEGRKVYDSFSDRNPNAKKLNSFFEESKRKNPIVSDKHKWVIPCGEIIITTCNIVCMTCKRTFEDVLSEYNSIDHNVGHIGDY